MVINFRHSISSSNSRPSYLFSLRGERGLMPSTTNLVFLNYNVGAIGNFHSLFGDCLKMVFAYQRKQPFAPSVFPSSSQWVLNMFPKFEDAGRIKTTLDVLNIN